jgi:hypothetical protein
MPENFNGHLWIWREPSVMRCQVFPSIGAGRVACVPRDCAEMDITVVDVRAVGTSGLAAAGERRHGPCFRRSRIERSHRALGSE